MLKCYGFIEHVCHSYLWSDIMNCGQWQIFHNPHRRLHLESLKALLVTTITRHQHQSHGLLHTKTTIAQKEKKTPLFRIWIVFMLNFGKKLEKKKSTYISWLKNKATFHIRILFHINRFHFFKPLYKFGQWFDPTACAWTAKNLKFNKKLTKSSLVFFMVFQKANDFELNRFDLVWMNTIWTVKVEYYNSFDEMVDAIAQITFRWRRSNKNVWLLHRLF